MPTTMVITIIKKKVVNQSNWSLLFRMHALDDMGDKSDIKKREQCFQEVDEDGSGAIDFEEFLGVSGNSVNQRLMPAIF